MFECLHRQAGLITGFVGIYELLHTMMDIWHESIQQRQQNAADAAKDALNLPDVRAAISKTTGLIPVGSGPDSLRQQTVEDTEKWQPIASRIGEK